MSDKPRPGEIFTERFVVARSKLGAGYVKAITPRAVTFTAALPEAHRFASKEAFVSTLEHRVYETALIGERDQRNYDKLGCTAEIWIGARPKGGGR